MKRILLFIFCLPSVAFSQTGWTLQTINASNDLSSVFFVDQYYGYIVGNYSSGQSKFYTQDGGDTWNGASIIGSPLSSVWATGQSTAWTVGNIESILNTADGGANWVEQNSGGLSTGRLYDIYMTSSTAGWAVGKFGRMYKTTDGTNWSTVNSGTSNELRGVWFVNSSTGWIAGASGTIRKTTNGGSNWSSQTSGATSVIYDVHFENLNTGWVVGGGGIIRKTTDGGTTWTAQASGTTNDLFSVWFTDLNNGWAVGASGIILFTKNGGTNWYPQNSNLTTHLYGVNFVNSMEGWIVGQSGKVLHTTNGGCDIPAAPAATSQQACFGSAVPDLTASGTGTMKWYSDAGLTNLLFTGSSFATGNSATGNYTYYVTQTVNNCEGPYATATLTINTLPSGNATATNVTCNGGNNGSVNLTSSGGTSPYTYLWSPGNQTTEDISNISAGNYSVTLTDNSGCTFTTTTNVSEPAAISATITPASAVCNGGNTGSANLTVSGGTSPYTYQWSSGATIQDISNLSAGAYTVTVTDASGCTKTATTTVQEPSPISTVITPINPSCGGSANGVADLDVTGGTPSYTYLWSTGAVTQDITNLAAGSYSVTITDANNCTAIDNISLFPSGSLVATVASANITCNGLCDGEATVSIAGGTSPYTISWNTTPVQSTATATGLCDGTYTVNVSDANNCQSTPSVTIVEPQAISFSENIVNSDCGSDNGSATISASGGVSPYSFVWSNGQTDSAATGLAAGTYAYTMTDSGGCSQSGSVDIIVAAMIPEICLVTVDSTSSRNLIIWEKPIAGNIDSFRVYRDIVGTDTHIGSVAYSDLSKFADTTNGINPNITSYKYKIASVDTCGNISSLSDFHKTIHLQINGANLTWDNYAGFASSFYYRILRDTLGIGNFIVLDSVPNTNFTWTDIQPPVISSAGYIIEIVHPFGGCTVTKSVENHNSSRSNKTFAAPPGTLPVADFSGNNLNINMGGSVNFTDMTANNPTTWSWTFSGGNPASSMQQNPANITYNTAGCFDVKLVASNAGGSDSITKTCYINVTSSGNAPVADFIASATNIQAGGSVDFLDFSTNNPASWKWLFSGGTPAFSLTQNPSGVVYNTSGCFDVTLIASNPDGSDTAVKTCYINVNSVGMEDIGEENGIRVYPNPNNGKFAVQAAGHPGSKNYSLKIFNILGEEIYRSEIVCDGSQGQTRAEIDLGRRGGGIYFIRVESEAGLMNKKIIIN